jgi:DNA-binding winged helix-turn-helix (wHTH) protein
MASAHSIRFHCSKASEAAVQTFLDFELDEDLFELRSRGEVISVQARVFAMIAYLLHARDRVVSKDELRRALWKGTAVSEATINQVVMLARKALRDEGESQRVIKTVRGRGFRFVAPVWSGADTDAAARAAPQACGAAQPSTTLLGRERELRLLGERLARAQSGQGGLVLIGGEPGIGKTSLAEALAAQALASGVEVLWGRAWDGGGAPPFWPWIQVLRAMTQRADTELLRRFPAPGGGALSPLLADFGQCTGEVAQAPGSPLQREEPDGPRQRFRQFDATARLLRYAAGASGEAAGERRHTRLIVLDDMHAADEASIQLTRFLLPELRELRLLIVATYGDLEQKSTPALASLVESAAGSRLQLRGLGPTQVSELITRQIGSAAPPRWAAAVYTLSAGNPLLVAELCRQLEPHAPDPLRELSRLADFALPERVAGAVRRHLAQLPGTTRELLAAASVLGREFSLPLLSALHACSESQLLEMLAPALRQGVVRFAGHSAGRLAFAHGLVCRTIYAELAPQRRLELDRKLAELLEHGASPGRMPLPGIAPHFCSAAADGCGEQAVEYARLAAAQACSAGTL